MNKGFKNWIHKLNHIMTVGGFPINVIKFVKDVSIQYRLVNLRLVIANFIFVQIKIIYVKVNANIAILSVITRLDIIKNSLIIAEINTPVHKNANFVINLVTLICLINMIFINASNKIALKSVILIIKTLMLDAKMNVANLILNCMIIIYVVKSINVLNYVIYLEFVSSDPIMRKLKTG